MVVEDRHPVDELLRAYTGDSQPDASDLAYVEERLLSAIEQEKQGTRRGRPKRWHGRRMVVAWAAALVAVTVGVAVFLQSARITPAAAALEEIAQIAEAVDPLTVSDTEFIYTRAEAQALSIVPRDGLGPVPYDKDLLVYLLVRTRETWFGSEDTVQIRTTIHEARFFTEADEAVYQAAGLAQEDRLGQTENITVTLPVAEEWPTDLEELDRTIRERMVTNRGLPETVEYLEVALTIIRDLITPAELRASTLRLIGELNGLQVHEVPQGADPMFYIDYTDEGVETRFSFAIDRQGHLRFEQKLNLTADSRFGIPANTATHQAEYTRPEVTDTLERP